MSERTPPHEFLSELGDINGFIADLLDCPRQDNSRWHWPSFYLLYVELDRLSMLLSQIACLLEPPLAGFEEDLSCEDDADSANALFKDIDMRQKTIVGSLYRLCKAVKARPEQRPQYDRVFAHVHPKSGWYQTFMQRYQTGEMAGDAQILVRTALPIDHGTSNERVDFLAAECMLREQSFDIGTQEAKLALVQATEAAGRRIGEVLRRMGEYLIAHCRIEDLRFPSSR